VIRQPIVPFPLTGSSSRRIQRVHMVFRYESHAETPTEANHQMAPHSPSDRSKTNSKLGPGASLGAASGRSAARNRSVQKPAEWRSNNTCRSLITRSPEGTVAHKTSILIRSIGVGSLTMARQQNVLTGPNSDFPRAFPRSPAKAASACDRASADSPVRPAATGAGSPTTVTVQ
jgi:hypothetical protein